MKKALKIYQKSAVLLDNGRSSFIDQGYIRHWVGQAMANLGRREDAVYFLRAAMEKWSRVSPSMAAELSSELADIVSRHPSLTEVKNAPLWKCDNRFSQWMHEKL